MKKGNRLLPVMIAGMLLICLMGCNKLLDYVNEHSGGHNISKYRIKTISGRGDYDHATATFTYNQWGDPVKIWIDRPATGRPHSFFTYDKFRRLKDYITTYDDVQYYERWSQHYYDAKGRVIRDTTWYLGERGEAAPKSFETKMVATYYYDDYGRITQVAYKVLNPVNTEFEYVYSYDGKGNRTWNSPPDTSDNKTNLLRTHPVWQLISNDYSLNNPFIADAYNEAGLPVKLHVEGLFEHFYFLWTAIPARTLEITYEKK